VQARAQFIERWKTQLPLSTPSFTFPKHLQEVEWADTRALWWVFCNRAPTDPPPNITANPCPYGMDRATSHHLLRECQLLSTRSEQSSNAPPQGTITPHNSSRHQKMPSRFASSSAQLAWATPRTSSSRRTNLQHKAPKTQVQTRLNQTSAPSKIKNNHTNETTKLEEARTGTNFLRTVGVFPCSNISVACLS